MQFAASAVFNLFQARSFLSDRICFDSRIAKDRYSDDDVLKMIAAVMSEDSVFIRTTKMTVLQNPDLKPNGYGCLVRIELTLECSASPLAELYSVVPRGDRNHKPSMKKGRQRGGLSDG